MIEMEKLDLSGVFNAGLFPRNSDLVDGAFLVECQGKRPSDNGLINHVTLTDRVGHSTVTWPFPQLFRLRQALLELGATEAYTINESTWGATLITTYNAASTGITKTITQGGAWQVADFNDVWFATNGTTMLARLPDSGTWKVVAQDSLTVKSVAEGFGRLLVSGMSGSRLSAARFTALFDRWMKAASNMYSTAIDQTVGANVVMYSEEQGGEVYYPFVRVMSIMGFPNDTRFDNIKAEIYAAVENGEIGFIIPFHKGTTTNIAQIADTVLLASADGITSVQSTENGLLPVDLFPFGPVSRGAMAGNHAVQYFVDQDGDLWEIGQNLQYRNLRFREWIGPLTLANLKLTYNETEGELYISDGTACYVYGAKGMSETTLIPTSLIKASGGIVAPVKSLSDATVVLKTGSLSLNNRRAKTLQEVELHHDDAVGDVTLVVQYKVNETTGFVTCTGIAPDSRGVFVVGITGVEFTLKFTFTNNSQSVGGIVAKIRADGRLSVKELVDNA